MCETAWYLLQERLHKLVMSIWVPVPNTPSEFQTKRLAPRRVRLQRAGATDAIA